MTVNNNQSVTGFFCFVFLFVLFLCLFILCLSVFISDIFKEREKRKKNHLEEQEGNLCYIILVSYANVATEL